MNGSINLAHVFSEIFVVFLHKKGKYGVKKFCALNFIMVLTTLIQWKNFQKKNFAELLSQDSQRSKFGMENAAFS